MAKHKHAALITEWIKDTSRKVLSKRPTFDCEKDIGNWTEWRIDSYPSWSEQYQYKFADEPKEFDVISSLTDGELVQIWVGDSGDEREKSIDLLRRLANAAAQRERDNICALQGKTSLTHSELKYRLAKYDAGDSWYTDRLENLANFVIGVFLNELKKGY